MCNYSCVQFLWSTTVVNNILCTVEIENNFFSHSLWTFTNTFNANINRSSWCTCKLSITRHVFKTYAYCPQRNYMMYDMHFRSLELQNKFFVEATEETYLHKQNKNDNLEWQCQQQTTEWTRIIFFRLPSETGIARRSVPFSFLFS